MRFYPLANKTLFYLPLGHFGQTAEQNRNIVLPILYIYPLKAYRNSENDIIPYGKPRNAFPIITLVQ